MRFSAKEGLFKTMRNVGEAVNIEGSESEDYNYLISKAESEHLEPEAFAAVPIVIVDDVLYVIFIDNENRTYPIDDEVFRSIVGLTKQAALSLERNFYKAKLQPQA
jgi:hypothetical protein